MKPIKFKKQNVVFAETQPEYISLPAYKEPDGCVTCCWKLSIKERFIILFTGKLWISMLTFNKPLQPLKPRVKSPMKNLPNIIAKGREFKKEKEK